MPQYDGAIRIVTKIQTRDAEESLSSLEYQIKKSAKYIDSLRSKMDALKGQKIYTDDYKKLQEELSLAKDKLALWNEELKKSKSEAVINQINKNIKEVDDTIESIQGKMQAIEDSGKAFTLGEDTAQYKAYQDQIKYEEEAIIKAGEHYQRLLEVGDAVDRTSEAYKKYQATLEELRNTETGIVSITDSLKATFTYFVDLIREKLTKLGESIKYGLTHPFQTAKSVVSGAFNLIYVTAQKAFNVIRSGISAVSKVTKAFINLKDKAKQAFSAITGSSKQANTSLSGGLKTILKYGFGIRSLYVLFNKIRNGIKEGFTNLMGYSDNFANSIQSVKNSMSTLGNQIAGAFRPIVEMVIPWLNSLISALTSAMAKLAQFIAVLGGKSTFTKAKKIQDDYNKSLGGTAKAADKARGALAKFDDLDVLQKQEDTSGGGVGGLDNFNDMFEEVEVDDKWKNIADWFREMWENSDFSALGKFLGEKLKESLENIDWNPIQETARKIGKSFATLINGFVEVEGLAESIGKTIGEAINTGIDGINAFLDNTHWDSVGKFIGDALNGLVDSIDWDDLGHFFAEKWNAIFETIGEAAKTFDWKKFGASLAESFNTWVQDFNWSENGAYLGDLIKGLLDALITFIEETDWQELGNKVADFVGSIDWTGIMERLSEGIGAALGGLFGFLYGLIEDAWKSVVEWWNETAYEDGQFTMHGLLDGILEAFSNIGNWIMEHIVNPFLDGFRKGFGIHSPSTVMAEIGGYVIEGLKNGILGAWNSLKDTVGNVADSVVNTFKDILGIHSPSTVMDENGAYLIEGLKNGVSENMASVLELFNTLGLSIEEILTALNESTSLIVSEMLEMIYGKWEELLQQSNLSWTELSDLITKTLTIINTNILTALTATNVNWTAKWTQMLNTTKKLCSEIVSAVSAMNNQVQAMCSAMIAAINAVKAAASSLGSVSVGGGSSGGGGARIAAPVSAQSFSAITRDIPHLASGSVIRGGNPFMAILGDQPRGQTNIEAPLSTIEQGLENVLDRRGYSENLSDLQAKLVLNINGMDVGEAVIDDFLSVMQRRGLDVQVLGVT